MAELVDFLLARIAEDQAVATVAATEEAHEAAAWHTLGCSIHPQGLEDTWCDCDVPARVLAECRAKRRIVEIASLDWVPDTILKVLALPYADHPDYDEAWRA